MELYIVDAFTIPAIPFSGNVAAVVLAPTPTTPFTEFSMQAFAKELNFSETAYIWPSDTDTSPHHLRIRWFTPGGEVSLCGHATLASAHVVLRELAGEAKWGVGKGVTFETREGMLLRCGVEENEEGEEGKREEGGGRLWIDFPRAKVDIMPKDEWDYGLLACHVDVEVVAVATTDYDVLVELEAEGDVRGLAPEFPKLAKVLTTAEWRGLIVTSRMDGTGGFDFCSRFFAPHMGIDEDPVTGSAHCALARYWSQKLGGKEKLRACQLSKRGGHVDMRLDNERKRVFLSGTATCVSSGRIRSSLSFEDVK